MRHRHKDGVLVDEALLVHTVKGLQVAAAEQDSEGQAPPRAAASAARLRKGPVPQAGWRARQRPRATPLGSSPASRALTSGSLCKS